MKLKTCGLSKQGNPQKLVFKNLDVTPVNSIGHTAFHTLRLTKNMKLML